MMKAQTFQDLGETCPWLKPSLALPTEPMLSLYGHTTNARRRQSDLYASSFKSGQVQYGVMPMGTARHD